MWFAGFSVGVAIGGFVAMLIEHTATWRQIRTWWGGSIPPKEEL